MNKVLVFSIATYGYDVIWDKCIESHQKYAKKNGYDYFCINEIPKGYTNDQVVWAKLPLILEGQKKYDRVVFLDADCMVQKNCPKFESLKKEGKYIYMGTGFSGRINSGVIITHTNKAVSDLFLKIIKNKDKALPKEDTVGWSFGGGENGHVIHYCKNVAIVEIVDKKWNNNADVELNDYIRHFSAGGPMRSQYKLSKNGQIQDLKIKIGTFWKKMQRKFGFSKGHQAERKYGLDELVNYCVKKYFS